MELPPKALHAEEVASNIIKLLVFPQYNITASNCRIRQFGSANCKRTFYTITGSNYFVQSPLIKSLLSESSRISSQRRVRSLIKLLTTTKHVWMYLLFIVIRYHQAFRQAISSSALPPYDMMIDECLDAYKNCNKLEEAIFQMFLIYKRHMAAYKRRIYLQDNRRLDRDDTIPADSTLNDTSMAGMNNQNNVREVTEATALATKTTAASISGDVTQSGSLVINELAASNSSDSEDNDSNGETENATVTPPLSSILENFEAFLSKRPSSFVDISKPSKISLIPPVHERNETASSQGHGSVQRNAYLQEYIDYQQLEAIRETEEEPEQKPGLFKVKNDSDLDNEEQPNDVKDNEKKPKDIKPETHTDEKHLHQDDTQHNTTTSNDQQPILLNIQQKQPSQMNALVNPQKTTTKAPVTPGTAPRPASGRRGGISQASSSIFRSTHQEPFPSSQSNNPDIKSKEEANGIYYQAVQNTLLEARINSLGNLGDPSKHYEINLLDPKLYYNPDGTENLYDGPKEIAEKLGI
ncbi:hypothetical protein V8B55DRAFT_1477598, partial [Mucor lusitanicus]